jgi:PAS domain S-box-containing protein
MLPGQDNRGSIPKSRLNRYLPAIVAVAAVVLLRMLLRPLLFDTYPYTLFNMSIMVAAWYGGVRAGIFAGVLSLTIGHYFFVQPFHTLHFSPGRDGAAGLIFCAVAVLSDWVARKLRFATARAEEGERRIGEILESLGDNFISLDSNWRFTWVNRAAEGMLGSSRAELLGRNIWQEFPKLEGSRLAAVCRQAYQDRTAGEIEYFHEPTKAWFEVRVYPSKEGGISVYFVNITERKNYEADVARFAELVESSGDAIMSVNTEGVIESWNSGAVHLYGYTSAEAIGRSIYMLLPQDRQDEESALLERMRRGERLEHFETTRVTKEGKHIRVSLSISPIRDAAGEIVGVSGIARDVTARIELEEQLRQSQKLESLGVLAGGVAHDFNNLLVAIMGNASLAMERLPALHPIRPLLQEAVQASERAAHLTRQLLAYAGRGRYIVEPVDLSELARESLELLRSSLPQRVEWHLELAADLPAVEADVAQMHQMVMNLVTNAAESLGENGGWVQIRTGVETVEIPKAGAILAPDRIRPGDYVWLEVRDNGCGMDEGTRARIFDPFFTTKFTGRGLGLSAVSGIVRGHAGMLDVESAPGQGSRFKFWLPAIQARKPAAPRDAVNALNGCGTVLFVDDEDVVRRTAKAALERYGYTVALAEDAEQAVRQFDLIKSEVLLVILDMGLPGAEGPDLVRRLHAIRPRVPIVLSSGFNEVEAARQFQGQGVAGFLQKPYTAVQLAEKVKAVALVN